MVDDTFEADAVAVAIKDFVTYEHPDGWEGTPSALQIALDEATPESIRKSRSWPKTPNQLGNRVRRASRSSSIKGARSIVGIPEGGPSSSFRRSGEGTDTLFA